MMFQPLGTSSSKPVRRNDSSVYSEWCQPSMFSRGGVDKLIMFPLKAQLVTLRGIRWHENGLKKIQTYIFSSIKSLQINNCSVFMRE